ALPIREEGSDELERLRPKLEEARSIVNAIGNEVDRRSFEDVNDASDIASRGVTQVAIALFICLTIAVALGIWTTRALTHPVMKLRHAMALVADGIFRVPENLPYERQD